MHIEPSTKLNTFIRSPQYDRNGALAVIFLCRKPLTGASVTISDAPVILRNCGSVHSLSIASLKIGVIIYIICQGYTIHPDMIVLGKVPTKLEHVSIIDVLYIGMVQIARSRPLLGFLITSASNMEFPKTIPLEVEGCHVYS